MEYNKFVKEQKIGGAGKYASGSIKWRNISNFWKKVGKNTGFREKKISYTQLQVNKSQLIQIVPNKIHKEKTCRKYF